MADSEECYTRRRKERNKEKERNEYKKKNRIKKAAKGPLHDARTRDEEKRQVSCDRIRCHVGQRVEPISITKILSTACCNRFSLPAAVVLCEI